MAAIFNSFVIIRMEVVIIAGKYVLFQKIDLSELEPTQDTAVRPVRKILQYYSYTIAICQQDFC